MTARLPTDGCTEKSILIGCKNLQFCQSPSPPAKRKVHKVIRYIVPTHSPRCCRKKSTRSPDQPAWLKIPPNIFSLSLPPAHQFGLPLLLEPLTRGLSLTQFLQEGQSQLGKIFSPLKNVLITLKHVRMLY